MIWLLECLLTPNTIKFKADSVCNSPEEEFILSICSIGYAEQQTLPEKENKIPKFCEVDFINK